MTAGATLVEAQEKASVIGTKTPVKRTRLINDSALAGIGNGSDHCACPA